MKQLLLLNIIIAALSTSVQAATINVIANEVLGTSGSFTTSPTGSTLGLTDLTDMVTSDVATFVMSNDDTASIDLGFGSNQVVTGAGADLVIYTVGNDYNFGLQVFDTGNNMISNFLYNVPVDGSSTAKDESGNNLCVENSTGGCAAVISATSIDIFGDNSLAVEDNIEISMIRLFIGTNSDFKPGGAYPLFSLAGAIHTTAVPLPLPVLLFTSGLALLGFIGRRKAK